MIVGTAIMIEARYQYGCRTTTAVMPRLGPRRSPKTSAVIDLQGV
jgi:hypothetical protein